MANTLDEHKDFRAYLIDNGKKESMIVTNTKGEYISPRQTFRIHTNLGSQLRQLQLVPKQGPIEPIDEITPYFTNGTTVTTKIYGTNTEELEQYDKDQLVSRRIEGTVKKRGLIRTPEFLGRLTDLLIGHAQDPREAEKIRTIHDQSMDLYKHPQSEVIAGKHYFDEVEITFLSALHNIANSYRNQLE